MCPSALVASLDVDVLVQDFTYPKWGTGQPIIIMFWKLLQQTFEMETKMAKLMVRIGNSKKQVEWKASWLAWIKSRLVFMVFGWNLSRWLVEAASELIALTKFSSYLAEHLSIDFCNLLLLSGLLCCHGQSGS